MEDKKKIERSTSYPSMNVEEALTRLVRLKDSMGLNGDYKRETVAKGIGYNTITGTSARSVAALVHYGLLIRSGDTYSISANGKRFLMPVNDTDKSSAIYEAALSPKLFEQLLSEFGGQVLPKLIANILTSKYGVQEKVASTVVKIFESSMSYAGLLSSSGLLVSKEKTTNENDAPSEAIDAHSEVEPSLFTDKPSSVALPLTSGHNDKQRITTSSFLNEQGTSHSGYGWSLAVSLKTSYRLDQAARDKVRLILDTADSLADDLYLLDEKGRLS